MDRLTDKKLKAACGYFINFASKEEVVKYRLLAESAPKYEEIYKKLADYEDKEEQGLLIELPVPVGTTVYVIESDYDDELESRYYLDKLEFDCGLIHLFGKWVFATEAEAEEALERMKGE